MNKKPPFPLPNPELDALVRRNKAKQPDFDSEPIFELVVQVRNSDGLPTGTTKTITTSKAEELESFYNRNSGTTKKKKRTRSKKNNKLLEQINNLSKLEAGWDGPHSKQINSLIIKAAKDLITSMSSLIDISSTRIVPVSLGSLQIEVKGKNNKELELQFLDDQTISYLMWDAENSFNESKEVPLNEVWKIKNLFKWASK